MELDDVLRRRLATQRLTTTPFRTVSEAVDELVCVQAQEQAISRWTLGLRTGFDETAVRAELDSLAVLRVHILRPTWHYVSAADLRWLLALTSDKVISSMAARHRQLELTPEIEQASERVLLDVLAGRTHLTRPEVGAAFDAAGLPSGGEHVAHLLGLAELRALVCSGPLRGKAHTYSLVDEVVPPTPVRERNDAIRELVRRFFVGHGPAGEHDLVRWTKLTLGEIRPVLAELEADGVLGRFEVASSVLWGAPDVEPERTGSPRAHLVETFDEIHLTYPDTNFPRLGGHPAGETAGVDYWRAGGIVILDRANAGWWTRKETGGASGAVEVTLQLADSVDAAGRQAVADAAERLAAFLGRPLVLR